MTTPNRVTLSEALGLVFVEWWIPGWHYEVYPLRWLDLPEVP